MDTLLLAGYGSVFVVLFGYLLYMQRQLRRLERQLQDLQ
ncbi:CcmD family protein [Natrinema hispanicum]|uniref:CcmD family protein n=1 Tax=Natrinema hispanicum TaxID=392421 RepID=A0A482YCX4_9EURY|nr:CcmD family protein [Natrinema hispanicum]RZV12097.1 CcmD family protein [Natrinema hispanicum]